MSQFSVGNLETLSDTEESTILDDVKAHYNTLHSDLIYERYNFDNRAQLTAAVKA
jgi:secreted Zn-dependent insulinase-like peptidase